MVTVGLISWPLPDVHHTIPRRSIQKAGFGVVVYLMCNKTVFQITFCYPCQCLLDRSFCFNGNSFYTFVFQIMILGDIVPVYVN